MVSAKKGEPGQAEGAEGKRALLINPPTGKYMRDDRCQAPVESMTAQPPRAPIDLAYMAACLEDVGVECRVMDYPMEEMSWRDLAEDLKGFRPDFLIMSTTTPTLEYDLKACRLAKKAAKALGKDIITIAKGAEITDRPKEVLEKYPDLDIGINGEYEFAVAEIATMPWSEVLGITYRENCKTCKEDGGDGEDAEGKSSGRIHKTAERPRLEDLDRLPIPARHLLNNDLYTAPDTGRPIAFILTGRGCPHRCMYCAVSVASGHKLHIRSVESVIKEIEQCYHELGIREFFFRSDTFTWYEDWVVELCKRIVDKKLKIRWGTNSRVDTVSEKRLHWMKKAGCYVIGFGIESGNQEMLRKMRKATTLDQARKAIALCRRYKIKSYALFMFGLPWETRETAEDTIRFSKELDTDFADFNIAYPLPGTEYYDIALKENLFTGGLAGFDYGTPLVKAYELSTDELKAIRKRAIREFYFRPKYILRTLLGIRSPRVFLAYIVQGSRLALNILKRGKDDGEEAA
ncbi:B12-binding domain-containing radical SAM protein [Candidatus Woesearchaeota archaeon]|nr:B12-binding domain-containing radical SAM protein [Candidatus Woesearchaeota archaeon]